MSEPLTIIAKITAAPGKADTLAAHVTALVPAVREEPGCLRYDHYRDLEHPDVFVFVEVWETKPLWDMHKDAAALQTFLASIGEGAIAGFEVMQLRQAL